jgi:hypothetical protein
MNSDMVYTLERHLEVPRSYPAHCPGRSISLPPASRLQPLQIQFEVSGLAKDANVASSSDIVDMIVKAFRSHRVVRHDGRGAPLLRVNRGTLGTPLALRQLSRQ